MKGLVFSTRAEAEAAQRALDAAAGLPRQHGEGTAAHDFRIDAPGAAADRIRKRGVRTEHVGDVIARPDGTAYAVVTEQDASAVDLAGEEWFVAAAGGTR